MPLGTKKGITLLGTGDFTHPAWIREIKEKLNPAEPGLFRLKETIEKSIRHKLPPHCRQEMRFILSVEISTIYKKKDKTRKVHHLIYAPSIDSAEKLNHHLAKIGNLRSDGRPILGLDSRDLLEIVLQTDKDCFMVPAHIWTPWFSVLGAKSGFDSIDECYGDLSSFIFAVETGLSADPSMINQVSKLDRFRLISNSDAHSPSKLGREVCSFNTKLDYYAIRRALETGSGYAGTLEFFPEEGKYYLDGHRHCGICFTPEETYQHKGICPVCHKPLTTGVLNRIQSLSDRLSLPQSSGNFKNIIPLPEIISEVLQTGPQSRKVSAYYDNLLSLLGPEICILQKVSCSKIESASSPMMAEAILRMRRGHVMRKAGFDGVYGNIRLFEPHELSKKTRSKVSAGTR